MHFFDRRDFLKSSAGLAGALAGGSWLDAAPVETQAQAQTQAGTNARGANERLNVAVVGVNGRGMSHIGGFAGKNNCVVTHICDVDPNVSQRAINAANKAQGGQAPTFVQDIRRLLENRDIHIISIATPNHWHALGAIWAMQAGKDVYVEKPVSHNVSEGRRMVEVAQRTGRICQAGTQIRSNPGIRQAMEFLKSGKLGKLQVARGLCYKRRDNAGGRVPSVARTAPPKGLDFNLWLGPAATREYHENLVHYRWHWFWDFGNGDLGNQGIHQMDVARWGIGKNELCRSVMSIGGRFGQPDSGETPNTQIIVADYGDAELIFEVRGLETKPYRGATVGNVFHCSDGYLAFPGYNSAIAYSPNGEVLQRFQGGSDQNHYDNFVRAVRNRRAEDLHGHILEGHLSSALCHVGNISYRLGRQEQFNGRAFGDDREAAETLGRMQEHLRDNRVAQENMTYRVGRRLTLDPKTERFQNDEEANRQLTREYRKGFEVPSRA